VRAGLLVVLAVLGCGSAAPAAPPAAVSPATPAAASDAATALFSARDPAHVAALQAIHQAPRIDGSSFDPAALRRAVDALRPLGRDTALDVLQTYDELARSHPGQDDLDAQRIFLIVRLLCDPVTPLAIGAPSRALPAGFTAWPRFPLVEQDGVPFLLVTGYTLAGKAESPLVHVRACREHGALRAEIAAGAPEPAAEALIASPAWHEVIHDEQAAAMVRAQAVRAVRKP
jgi:hypothetical protein